jgi:hypothetical protein
MHLLLGVRLLPSYGCSHCCCYGSSRPMRPTKRGRCPVNHEVSHCSAASASDTVVLQTARLCWYKVQHYLPHHQHHAASGRQRDASWHALHAGCGSRQWQCTSQPCPSAAGQLVPLMPWPSRLQRACTAHGTYHLCNTSSPRKTSVIQNPFSTPDAGHRGHALSLTAGSVSKQACVPARSGKPLTNTDSRKCCVKMLAQHVVI